MLSHHNLATNHRQFLTASGINSSDATLIFVPFYHIYGVLLTGSFLAAGAKQVIVDRFELEPVLDLCEKHRPTWLFAVPAMVQALANYPGRSPPNEHRHVSDVCGCSLATCTCSQTAGEDWHQGHPGLWNDRNVPYHAPFTA